MQLILFFSLPGMTTFLLSLMPCAGFMFIKELQTLMSLPPFQYSCYIVAWMMQVCAVEMNRADTDGGWVLELWTMQG